MSDASATPGPIPPLPERFTVKEELGRGAQGVVVRAFDAVVGADVALKILSPAVATQTSVVERMRREAALVRRVRHPGVCRIHDLQQTDTATFLVMDVVEGQPLADLTAEGPLPVSRCVRLVSDALDAIAAVHAVGVVHRDLKPHNVLVTADDRVVVVDFGVATAADLPKLTEVDVVVGTRAYMAPEIWLGAPATALADVFALGVMLYELLTGNAPYGESTEGGVPVVVPPSAQRADCPIWLDAVVLRAMAPAPKDRFSSARAFQAALAAGPDAVAPGAATLPSVATQRRPSLLPRRATAVFVAGALVALSVGVWERVHQREPTGAAGSPAVSRVPDAGVAQAAGGGTAAAEPTLRERPAQTGSAADAGPRAPEEIAASSTGRSTTQTLAAHRRAAVEGTRQALRARGLRPGDLPSVDVALRTMGKASSVASVDRAEAAALGTIAAFKPDAGFLDRKLQRLNAAYAALGERDKAAVAPLLSRASAALGAGKDEEANRALSAGLDRVDALAHARP